MAAGRKLAYLTEETLVEYRAAFDSFDSQNSGKVGVLDIPQLMRKIGLMPSNLEIDELISEVDKDKNVILEGISFEQFCALAAKKYNEVYTETDIIEAFRTFDSENNGYISASELRKALCGMGEKLTEDEMDALIQTAQQDENGNVHYEQFVRNIMSDQ